MRDPAFDRGIVRSPVTFPFPTTGVLALATGPLRWSEPLRLSSRLSTERGIQWLTPRPLSEAGVSFIRVFEP
jgi:hypothetical protein